MGHWPNCLSSATIPTSSVASITRNFRASRISRIHCYRVSSKPVSRSTLTVRRALQPIQNRSAESLARNSFCNDKIDIERVELAQVAKQIGGGFAKMLLSTQVSNRDEAFVVFNRIPRDQRAAFICHRRKRFQVIKNAQRRFRRGV